MGIQELELLKELLNSQGIIYRVLEHEPVYSSEEAAQIRGVQLKTGVKALVLKTFEGNLILGLVAADRRINFSKLAKLAKTKRLYFASPEEVFDSTGCEVGSVHPFGNLYSIPTFMDNSVQKNALVNFNAGLHTISIQMKTDDLVEILSPIIGVFSKNQ
jgi:Ala-tRNA(Pro) deacylase